ARFVQTLYDEAVGASIFVSLVGVTSDRRAFVRIRSAARPRDTPALYAVDTIDLRHGARTARWQATPQNATALTSGGPLWRAAPMTGTVVEDLWHWAEILRTTGPWGVTRVSHPLAVAPDGSRLSHLGVYHGELVRLLLEHGSGDEHRLDRDSFDSGMAV